ncbi:S8 family serine peptidase [Oceanivirga miroungae]|uniref:Outer membrane autotransporter barrel domain-containing protein n=1 Tax=Oceanivirga miroungae TaxID=1130046 RepID=A0A6I8MA60_9FUSO|nr:S8 family serine peptidase [Oceanivirga miroungae]VWL85710.1 outer membrane autotransporter barrel domain-containing protein [Oceanivirga miroungae]
MKKHIYILLILSIASCAKIDFNDTFAPDPNRFKINVDRNNYKVVEEKVLHATDEYSNNIKNTVTIIEHANKIEEHKKTVNDVFKNTMINGTNNLDIEPSNFWEDQVNTRDITGIINMSFGGSYFNLDMGHLLSRSYYIDKIQNNLDPNYSIFFSDRAYDKDYLNNEKLKVIALGNTNYLVPTKNNGNSMMAMYQVMSPSMQKIARSESILVKFESLKPEDKDNFYINKDTDKQIIINKNENNEYYGNSIKLKENSNTDFYMTDALLLRSFTVGEDGYVKGDENSKLPENMGSSFSTPRVSRLAYEIKKKYPFLTYQQVKQVILTTAKKDSKYISIYNGWGHVDREKAMKGPSDLNAGLIEEQKYFRSNYDKIYDKDKNLYFYVDINDGKEYTFSNDIKSGLDGDGNTNEDYDTLKFEGTPQTVNPHSSNIYTYCNEGEKSCGNEFRHGIIYKYRIPKVLDSERNYYSNVKKAGLRKNGNGTLVLEGEQLYDTKTQILGGKLVLKNNSNSEYEVFAGSNFEINSNNNLTLNKITSQGTVDFNSNISSLKSYEADNNSTTILHPNNVVNADSFKLNGTVKIGDDTKELSDLKNLVKAKTIDANINNIYLEPIVIDNGKYVTIDFVNKISKLKNVDENYTKLRDLNEEQLRNIPSYKRNEKTFFDMYKVTDRVKYFYSYYMKIDNRTGHILSLSAKSPSKEDKKKAISQIFTDNYSSYISSLLDNIDDLDKSKNNMIFTNSNIFNKLSFSLNTYNKTNFIKGKNYDPFNLNLNSVNLGINYDNKFNGYITYAKSKYKFNDDSIFNNHFINLDFNYNYNKNLSILNSIGYNYSKVNRQLINEIVKNDFHSALYQNKLIFKNDINLDKIKTNLSLYIQNTMQFLNVFGNKEKSIQNAGIKIKNTFLFNDKISLGINSKTKLNNNIDLINRLDVSYNSINDTFINASILGIDTKLYGKNVDKVSANYSIGFNSKINKFIITTSLDIDTKGKIGFNLGITR